MAAGPRSDAAGTGSGLVVCYRSFPLAPSTYCVAKPNSLGCSPSMGWSGASSAGSGLPISVGASNVLNNKGGLLFCSHLPASTPFQGGTKCVAAPARRIPTQS